jgi:predicted CoA-binding protein
MSAPPDSDALRELLEQVRTVAIVGLSPDEQRPSHGVARYLQAHGYRIVPVNPRCSEVLGERCFASLEEIPFPVDLVDVFRRTEDVVPIARSAVAIGARGLWQQLGVVNEEADAIARAGGLVSVMDRCIKIDHQLLLPST